jgi:protein-tyrosine kinase
MSSLIEQAAQRLEQLRQAGVTLPEMHASVPGLALCSCSCPGRRERVRWRSPLPHVRAGRAAQDWPTACGTVGGAVAARQAEPGRHRRVGHRHAEAPRSQMADQYRVIKRPLIANAVGRGAASVKHGNLIMVTSACRAKARASPRSTWR